MDSHVQRHDYAVTTVNHFEREYEKTFLKLTDLNLSSNERDAQYVFSSFDSQNHGVSQAYTSAIVYNWLLDQRRN